MERIIELQQGIGFTAGGCLDGTVVTRFPAEAIRHLGANGVPLIAGTTKDEGTLLTSMMDGLRAEVLHVIAEGLAEGTFEGGGPSAYLARLGQSLGNDDADEAAGSWRQPPPYAATTCSKACGDPGDRTREARPRGDAGGQ